ncbi:MAG: adenylate kinase [Candidatus Saccharicenans sp.]
MRVILIGPPGSGKGTQAELIQQHYGFPKISTGDLLREAVQEGTEIGNKVAEVMKAGQLVADEIVLELVKARIFSPDCQSGYILDGFPRNLNQAWLLERIDGQRQEIVLEILITLEEISRRLSSRRVCVNCGAVYNIIDNKPKVDGVCDLCGSALIIRDDDRPEVIKERFRIYLETIKPLIEHYSRKKVLFQVDGQRPVEEVFKVIRSIIDQRLAIGQREVSS